jgi:4-hydroxybenzoate polyprenyltransferase
VKRVADWLSLVRFSHSIFALPFALQGAWLAQGGAPSARTLALIVVCAVAARTGAMAFNRLADQTLDARNPRTAGRELPAGRLSAPAVGALVALASAAFVAGAFALNPLAGRLSFPVLVVLLGYSFVKRFSFLAHAVLGLALALAPLGAWIAVRGELAGDLVPVLGLACAVWTWVFGFDLIYACQDVAFDRAHGLHSIPARFGVRFALGLSALLHVGTVAFLVFTWWSAGLSWVYGLAVAVSAALLVWEHGLVRPDDLSRVNAAFFTVNGWVGVGLFVGLVLDPDLGRGAGGV